MCLSSVLCFNFMLVLCMMYPSITIYNRPTHNIAIQCLFVSLAQPIYGTELNKALNTLACSMPVIKDGHIIQSLARYDE